MKMTLDELAAARAAIEEIRARGWRPVYPKRRRSTTLVDGVTVPQERRWAWASHGGRVQASELVPTSRQVVVCLDGTVFVRRPSAHHTGWANLHTLTSSSVLDCVDLLSGVGTLPSTHSIAYAIGLGGGIDQAEDLAWEKELAQLLARLDDPNLHNRVGVRLAGLLGNAPPHVRRRQVAAAIEAVRREIEAP